MATSVFNQGSYTVSGIAPPRRGMAEQFQAGLQANLGRQDARSVMAARGEATRLAQNADKRAQTELEMRQEAMRQQQARAAQASARAAQASARAAQQRQAAAAFRAGLRTPGASAPAAAPTSVVPAAPPSRTVTVPTPGTVGGGGGVGSVAGDLGTDVLGAYSGGYGAGQIDPGLMRAAGLSFAAPPVPAPAPQAAGIPTLPDGTPDWAAFEQQLNAAGGGGVARPPMATTDVGSYGPAPFGVDQITTVDPTRSAAMQDLQALSRRLEIDAAARTIGNSARERTSGVADYVLRTPEENARRAEARAQGEVVSDWYGSDAAQQLFQSNPELLELAARDALGFYQQYSGAPAPTGTEPSNAAAAAPSAAPDTQRAGLSFGAMPQSDTITLDMGEAVRETDGEPSKLFRGNTALQQRQLAQADQRLAQISAELDYYDQIGDTNSYIGALNRYNAEQENLFFLKGMSAVTSLEAGDFGAAQQLLQSEWFPGQDVELRPYTDGSVDVIVNGVAERMEWSELGDYMRGGYDRQAMEFAQEIAQATQAAAITSIADTAKAQTEVAKELAVYEGQKAFEQAINKGKLELQSGNPELGNFHGKDGSVPVSVEQVIVGKGDNQTVRYILRPIGTEATE